MGLLENTKIAGIRHSKGYINCRSMNATFSGGYSGFASNSNHFFPYYYIVVISDVYDQNVEIHEYEHLKNRLIGDFFEKQADSLDSDLVCCMYDKESDPLVKQALVEDWFFGEREVALERAKDEIIAMKKDRCQYSYGTVFFSQDNSSYDYLFCARNSGGYDMVWQNTAQRMLVEEYKSVIKRALLAFDKLEKEGKYSREEVIALFTDKPLSRWPGEVRRLLAK